MIKNAIAYITRKRNRTLIIFIIITIVLSCLYSCLTIMKSSNEIEKALYESSNSSISITKKDGKYFNVNQFKDIEKLKEIEEIIMQYDGLAKLKDAKVVSGEQRINRLEFSFAIQQSADESILFELGLDKKQIKRNVMKLSGGQQQRVAIARALVSDAPIILADEPTGNLDSVTAGEIINILKTLAKDRNKCVIVVTHSKEVADSADIILELSGKKLKKVNKMNLEVE